MQMRHDRHLPNQCGRRVDEHQPDDWLVFLSGNELALPGLRAWLNCEPVT
jgi:hypothetical protein